jgi:DNA polymerase I
MDFKTDYQNIWFVVFVASSDKGETPSVECMVAINLLTGEELRLSKEDLHLLSNPPFDQGDGTLYVAFDASKHMGCHLSLGWDSPDHLLDLYVEFRNYTNGKPSPSGNDLTGALIYFGLDSFSCPRAVGVQDLEQKAILNHCGTQVSALLRLLPVMEKHINFARGQLRGEYLKSVAVMERNGIPIDTVALDELTDCWKSIQDQLIEKIDRDYEVYDGRVFNPQKFEAYLNQHGIPWPRQPSGQLDLKDDTFKEQALAYLELQPLRELRKSLSQLKLNDLAVGSDGRNRCSLSPFRSITGRNQPSSTRFIFGNPAWLRGLIKPTEGQGVAYIDYCQQEFGIAAALSHDQLMMDAYRSGDPYLSFAMQAGAIPENATKQSHKTERERFKACALAVQYGMGAEALAQRINQPVYQAIRLLEMHRNTYRTFWQWSDASLDYAMLHSQLQTVFGWRIQVGKNVNPRSLRNFPMQANGAEMLRLAINMVIDAGIKVCAPIHDAILIEAPLQDIDHAIVRTQQLMSDASAEILDGFRLRTDVDVVHYPDRYRDDRGQKMWDTVMELVHE